ncbi:MAG TPA: hypothetical protein VF384_00470 [Planctomycetota bacterium]
MKTTRTVSTLLSVAAALAAGLSAQKVSELEPNDSPATAMPITAGTQIAASWATTADEDWFSFTLAAPGQVHLHTVGTGTLSLPVTRDNRIAIYDATGTVRLAWNDGAVGLMADCGASLPAGSYTARVNLKSGTAAAYDLDFFVLPVEPIDVVEGAEPNGASGLPTWFTPGETLEGNILPGGDEDYWSFTMPCRGIVLAATGDDGGVPQLDNLALRFHSYVPHQWVAIGAGDATNSQSHRVGTLAHPGMLDTGTYGISVKGGPAASGTAPWDFAKTGKYSLRTAMIALPDNTFVQELPEPNNTHTTPAGVVNYGDAAIGNSTGSLDEDWYLLPVGGSMTVGAMAEGSGLSPLAGSTLRLWNETGTTVLATASGSATTHGRLVFTVERGGIYYLSIQGPTVSVTGDYVLHIGAVSPLFVSSSTRVEPASTNACIGSNGLRPMLGYMQGETPSFGSTFFTRVERTLPSSFAIAVLGLSNTVGAGSVPLPLLLGYGGLDSQSNPSSCFLRVDPVLTMAVLTDAGGSGEYSVSFAYSPSALGVKIWQQAICFDPSLNALGLSVSNDASYVLGDRPF